MKSWIKTLVVGCAFVVMAGAAHAQTLAPLNSDTETDRVNWSELQAKFGPVPAAPKGAQIGGVSKTLTNEYWRSLGEGYQAYAKKAGVEVVYQAAQSEGDQLGQLSIAENLISQGFDALLLSPQTDSNLQPALESAEAKGIPVINVNDAVIPTVRHYVGNVQRDNGVRVAKWFLKNRPQGGKVAVIEGQAGVFAAGQRTKGFSQTIVEGGKFTVVASVPGNWDRQIPMTRPRRSFSRTRISSASTPTMTAWRSAWSRPSRPQGSRTRSWCSGLTGSPTPTPRSVRAI